MFGFNKYVNTNYMKGLLLLLGFSVDSKVYVFKLCKYMRSSLNHGF